MKNAIENPDFLDSDGVFNEYTLITKKFILYLVKYDFKPRF